MNFFKKSAIIFSIFLGFSAAHAENISDNEDVFAQRMCAFVTEETANTHCLKEQKDEVLIKHTLTKGLAYVQNNFETITNNIETVIGLDHFSNKLEEQILNANILNKEKELVEKEFELSKKMISIITAKFDQLETDYKKDLDKWISYKSKDKNEESGVLSFAKKRDKLLIDTKERFVKMRNWTKDIDTYVANKSFNKEVMLPLYLGENVKVTKEQCGLVKANAPILFEKKKEQLNCN